MTVSDLWQAPSAKLRRVWGGVNGVLFHQMLHGADIQDDFGEAAPGAGRDAETR
jgi:hypothetical protein